MTMRRSLCQSGVFFILLSLTGCIPDNYTFILQETATLENEVADALVQVHDGPSGKVFKSRAIGFSERRTSLKERTEALSKVLQGTNPEKSLPQAELERLKGFVDLGKRRVTAQTARVQSLLASLPQEDARDVSEGLSKIGGGPQ